MDINSGGREPTSESGYGMSLALFGGAQDNGNLGVAALGSAVVEGLYRHRPDAQITVFDNGWGLRTGSVVSGSNALPYQAFGARLSRRYHRAESLQRMYASACFGRHSNPALKVIARAAATLDVSGGDSFTDMYGNKRFNTVALPKKLALRAKSPLILLPQTYGPFYESDSKRVASKLIRASRAAWARDDESFEVLRELLGDDFDQDKHRLGVDMAFGLVPTVPPEPETDDLRIWVNGARPLAGINISGLLLAGAPKGTTYDVLSLDYRLAMKRLTERLLTQSDASVLFVPHVLTQGLQAESDAAAIESFIDGADFDTSRIRVLGTEGLTANIAKWWIGQCDWFCGARMHSTIAALSTGVPTAAIAYSLKTKPVFATVGQSEHVVDGRSSKTEEATDRLWASWQSRAQTKLYLSDEVPVIRETAETQMQEILDTSLQADSEVG